MEDRVAVIIWPDGTYIEKEDFDEAEWYFKSDDYRIEYMTQEEYYEFIGYATNIEDVF